MEGITDPKIHARPTCVTLQNMVVLQLSCSRYMKVEQLKTEAVTCPILWSLLHDAILAELISIGWLVDWCLTAQTGYIVTWEYEIYIV